MLTFLWSSSPLIANIWTIRTNKTYSTDGLFRAQYTFLVAGGEWADDDDDDDGDGDCDNGDDVYWLLMSDGVGDMESCKPHQASKDLVGSPSPDKYIYIYK